MFVENDNTLSHLLEFISSKLVDSDDMPNLPPIVDTSLVSAVDSGVYNSTLQSEDQRGSSY